MDLLENVFTAIGMKLPEDEDICIYKSGIVDSFELMQIILELELLTGTQLNISELVTDDLSLKKLRTMINVRP
jgi:acyl carrier protein